MGRAPYVFALMVTLLVLIGAYTAHETKKWCTLETCEKDNTHTLCRYTLEPDKQKCGKVVRSYLTRSEIDELLNIHNRHRQFVALGNEKRGINGPQPRASKKIPKLKWSDEIAEIAQTWANQCPFKHDECRNTETSWVGQNIALKAIVGNELALLNDSVTGWYNEVEKFNRRHIKPFVFSVDTGHYTQVVWAGTTKLGCGAIRYYKWKDGWKWNCLILVCNYEPSGNVIGGTMYETP